MPKLLEILHSNSEYVTESGCLIWLATAMPSGYGKMTVKRRSKLAHRVMWEETYGPIPDGLFVLHRCDVPCCINPKHLFLGTDKDNSDDKIRKGRHCTGERQGLTKLTNKQAAAIRNDPRRQYVIAAEYGIHRQVVWRIKNRQSFKDA